MKKLFILCILCVSPFALGGTNLSDAVDANEVPAEIEQREEEVINRVDAIDNNQVPETLEQRETDEKWRQDYDSSQEDVNDEFDN